MSRERGVGDGTVLTATPASLEMLGSGVFGISLFSIGEPERFQAPTSPRVRIAPPRVHVGITLSSSPPTTGQPPQKLTNVRTSTGMFAATSDLADSVGCSVLGRILVARHVLAPAVMLGLALLVGARGDQLRVMVLQSSLPQAVVTFVSLSGGDRAHD